MRQAELYTAVQYWNRDALAVDPERKGLPEILRVELDLARSGDEGFTDRESPPGRVWGGWKKMEPLADWGIRTVADLRPALEARTTAPLRRPRRHALHSS
jgi:hypothetical protein